MSGPSAVAPALGVEAPAVTVIVPTFNRASMLQQCIDSVLNQTAKPLEIIVVDDGSTDATAILAKEFPPIVRYLAKRNEGKAAALNFALPFAAVSGSGSSTTMMWPYLVPSRSGCTRSLKGLTRRDSS